jgi:hypothetical protein
MISTWFWLTLAVVACVGLLWTDGCYTRTGRPFWAWSGLILAIVTVATINVPFVLSLAAGGPAGNWVYLAWPSVVTGGLGVIGLVLSSVWEDLADTLVIDVAWLCSLISIVIALIANVTSFWVPLFG